MLKALAVDYKFLHISEDNISSELTAEQQAELDNRYEYVLQIKSTISKLKAKSIATYTPLVWSLIIQ